MYSNHQVFKGTFFALSLQEHSIIGSVFNSHIVKLFSKEGGIYNIVDNVSPINLTKWSNTVPLEGENLVKIINEMSEGHLYKVLGKGKKSLAAFYKEIESNEVFGNYVVSYLERRMSKCYDHILLGNIPVFVKDKKFSNLYHEHLLDFGKDDAQPIFKFSVTPTETQYTLLAKCNGDNISLKHNNAHVICNNPSIIRLGNKVYRFSEIDSKKIAPFFTRSNINVPKSSERKYFETFVLNTIKNQTVIAEGFEIQDIAPEKQAILSLEPKLNGSLGLTLVFRYGNRKYIANSAYAKEVKLVSTNDKYIFTRFQRDKDWEDNIKATCQSLGLNNIQGAEFTPAELPTNQNSNYEIVEWLNRNQATFIENGLTIEQQASNNCYYLNSVSLDLHVKTKNDWFDIYGNVILSSFQFPFINLRKNIVKGIREYVLPNGEIFIIPHEWFAKYKSLFVAGKDDDESLTVQRSCFALIEKCDVECVEASELKKRFESISLPQEIDIPKGLKTELRNYQKIGLLWLQLLYENRIGGCLADDMGLGKTIQTLAMLQYDLENRNGTTDTINENGTAYMGHTSLLVVPTSLVFNWQREIERFAPQLKTYQLTGPNRTRSIATLNKYNIVVTTYGVLRNDIEMLKDFRFNYVILDESQTIKNPASKGYRAAMMLNGKHFITLSGTPVENSLTDLWAQLNFINRGMLGSLKNFNNQYITPIVKLNDEKQQEHLKELVKPFILRRTKDDVAPELPELAEQVIYCNLTEEQKSIYEEEKSMIRNQILDSIDNFGYNKSTMPILRGLTRLRQIANHPKMLEYYKNSDSGKFDEVVRSIENLVAENHKILVFSSFVKHLRIVEEYLKSERLSYQMLIGSTTNRKDIVDKFQNDPESKVFLISIKAGGIGLNLTAADYILVLDPWWNPAVENQAIARAHRIGQDKHVFVYRFISVDTVEQKIQKLQEKKLLLANEFVGKTNPLNIIDQEQMMEILS